MAFPSLGSVSRWKLGFFSSMLFYALGFAAALVLAQFMPVADMCNPGLPFYVGLLTLVLGSICLAAGLLAFLLGYRTRFVKGVIAAHILVLVGPAVLVLA
ncbi:hypothetical protein [Hymenobacter properus]|uniref:Uncharacterized protein n=1 Tax=Hymenobacter properus TaxID=2791026 RepID=A0A931FMI8_9BACT|nr:hypothetical protein [Hymenobacter properus]MBF9144015.1 hypothetical protein [Hymenobacter properus]MBR7722832.1 hypothetical protein [Microvirga sp. SRT04]